MLQQYRHKFRHFREDFGDSFNGSRTLKIVFFALCVYLLIALGLGVYWSFTPKPFNVIDATMEETGGANVLVTGSVTTATTIKIVDVMLNKPGGFLRNDIMPPGVWLDNVPNWEYGALMQVRDITKAMRESFARSQSQSKEDPDLSIAEPRFNFSANSWILPSSEGIYEEGNMYLRNYLERLADPAQPTAQFYARADNLNMWLAMVSARMGSLSQRLGASVASKRVNTDLAGDPAARQSTPTAPALIARTPWYEVDDVFFEARGATWAILMLLQAVSTDFEEVLANKNASASLQQIIRELEYTQQPLRTPIVMWGSGFGMLPNHSLVMASYISRANAGLIELRTLLSQG